MIDLERPVLKPSSNANKQRRRRGWLGLIAVLLMILIGAAFIAERSPGPAVAAGGAQMTPPAPSVSVAIVESRKIAVWSDFSGRTEAVGRVALRPRVAGAILAVHFREGALVHAGDPLFTIDPAPFAAEVQRLQAQVEASEASVALAAKEQSRGQRLVPSGAMAQRDLDQRVDNFRDAQANLRAAQAALTSGQLNLDYTEVRAPISGRVGKIEVTPGNLVDAGANAPVLTTLVSVDPIYASFEADEATVAQLLQSLPMPTDPKADDLTSEIGQIPVQMGSLGSTGTPYHGTLQLIDNVVASDSGTIRLRAVFANPDGRLIPGQFARVKLGEAAPRSLIAIDERAIGTDQDRRFVLVVGHDNVASYREVQLGNMADGLRVITSGLAPGERVIVEGTQRTRPGMQVAPTIVQMASAEGQQATP